MTVSDDSQSTASNSTDASIITVIEDNSSQEVASTSSYTSVTALSDDIVNTDHSCHTSIYCYHNKTPTVPHTLTQH